MCVAVFDLGGTLMEYAGMPESWAAFYEQGFQAINRYFNCGATPTDIANSVEIFQSWNPRIIARENEASPEWLFQQAIGHWANLPQAHECAEVFFRSLHLKGSIYPDTIPCLSRLREGGVRIAALTDLPSGMPDEFFKRDITELLPYIDFYVSSAVCGFRKPNRRGLEMIAEHFHLPLAELVLFGDEEKDRQTAENAGCRFVEVRRRGRENFDLWKLVQEQIIIAHTMEYVGPVLTVPDWHFRSYSDADYPSYRAIYNDCFSDMRRALHLTPVYCCADRASLRSKARDIFILETAGEMVGSVAIYGNEIDDLIVARKYQGKGYGQGLLRFAAARMQRLGICPIVLHVADWNKKAMGLYKKNGFVAVKTEIVSFF